jgi:uncharacterized protein
MSTKMKRKPFSSATDEPRKNMRTCVACRTHAKREDLLRFVIDPQAKLWLDPHLKAPGRGAHLCYVVECLQLAIHKKGFQRSFKRSLLPIDFDHFCQEILNAQKIKINNLLALGRRKGHIVSGLNLLQSNVQKLQVLIFAKDASHQSRNKLQALVQCPLFVYEESALLGQTQGKAKRVALGIIYPQLATRIIQEFNRYQNFLLAYENPLQINTTRNQS